MKKQLFQETYPIFTLELGRDECLCKTIDDAVEYFVRRIESHPTAVLIARFDHLAHTRSLGGDVAEGIRAAVNIVFCFGTRLPNPQMMAVRPRSIGIVENETGFVVSFMEAPMPPANQAMEQWALGLRDPGAPG